MRIIPSYLDYFVHRYQVIANFLVNLGPSIATRLTPQESFNPAKPLCPYCEIYLLDDPDYSIHHFARGDIVQLLVIFDNRGEEGKRLVYY